MDNKDSDSKLRYFKLLDKEFISSKRKKNTIMVNYQFGSWSGSTKTAPASTQHQSVSACSQTGSAGFCTQSSLSLKTDFSASRSRAESGSVFGSASIPTSEPTLRIGLQAAQLRPLDSISDSSDSLCKPLTVTSRYSHELSPYHKQ